jgi:hypothetical protein
MLLFLGRYLGFRGLMLFRDPAVRRLRCLLLGHQLGGEYAGRGIPSIAFRTLGLHRAASGCLRVAVAFPAINQAVSLSVF